MSPFLKQVYKLAILHMVTGGQRRIMGGELLSAGLVLTGIPKDAVDRVTELVAEAMAEQAPPTPEEAVAMAESMGIAPPEAPPPPAPKTDGSLN